MLDINQIISFYPKHLRSFKLNILREYLQYKILEIVFDSEEGNKLAFMGGTAAHIIHSNSRFSQDLDFDNLGLSRKSFIKMSELIKKKLKLQGYNCEIKNVFKGALRSYIRISDILFKSGLSGHKEEKLLINLDVEAQGFDYLPDKIILNKFDVFLYINVVPQDILLSQKILCIFNRKRPMGRDFYDTVFLLGKTKPNMNYLRSKLGIKDKRGLKKKLGLRIKSMDFKALARDAEPFLFAGGDCKKVLLFSEYIKNYEF
ncbi:MAG: nucleotidyl transferase AbiEii/AbiGii toxin family protein [Candidatus Omnitrophota bacterium]